MRRFMILGLLILGACGTPGGRSVSPTNRDQITRQEITRYPGSNALEMIQRLRPEWLHLRGQQSFVRETDLVVYLNNARMGGTESLRGIDLEMVQRIRYFDATAATLRWGSGHTAGAILLTTTPEFE